MSLKSVLFASAFIFVAERLSAAHIDYEFSDQLEIPPSACILDILTAQAAVLISLTAEERSSQITRFLRPLTVFLTTQTLPSNAMTEQETQEVNRTFHSDRLCKCHRRAFEGRIRFSNRRT